nr:MAG TPA: hypothetical protein [Caudoviricetes sp.]
MKKYDLLSIAVWAGMGVFNVLFWLFVIFHGWFFQTVTAYIVLIFIAIKVLNRKEKK